jgi:hypothetical protein
LITLYNNRWNKTAAESESPKSIEKLAEANVASGVMSVAACGKEVPFPSGAIKFSIFAQFEGIVFDHTA